MTEPRTVLVDVETGEQIQECAHCRELEAQVTMAERELRKYRGRITQLERDAEAEAHRHKLWDEAAAIFDWWRIACSRYGVTFNAEQFGYMLPRLKKRSGHIAVLKAIAGAAFDPGTKRMGNGRIQRFDSVELICRSEDKLISFQERAPGREGTDDWKLWLVHRLERRLFDADKKPLYSGSDPLDGRDANHK